MESHQYFIGIARSVAAKSKDPSSKVGAVIVDKENRIVSTGYNGFVAGCDESKLSWERPHKYMFVVHAELNALIYARRDLKNCKLYCVFGPCENCLKHILQSGVREIYYSDSSIIRDRGTLDQKEAIKFLIEATDAIVENINGQKYVDEIYFREV